MPEVNTPPEPGSDLCYKIVVPQKIYTSYVLTLEDIHNVAPINYDMDLG
jgi:hypothetical protein